MDTSMAFAFLLVSLGGLLTGVFALPMKLITSWKWENIWLSFSFFGFFLIPVVVLRSAIPSLWGTYSQVALERVLLIAGIGYFWGLGAVTYGLSIDRLGMASDPRLCSGFQHCSARCCRSSWPARFR